MLHASWPRILLNLARTTVLTFVGKGTLRHLMKFNTHLTSMGSYHEKLVNADRKDRPRVQRYIIPDAPSASDSENAPTDEANASGSAGQPALQE